jgi:NTE family protein
VVTLVAAFGAFLAFLDSTIVNIAFPAIRQYFHSDIGDLSWVLNAYNIVFATLLVAAGKVADLVGRKRLFICGVLIFTLASGLCAVADTVGQLIAFRVVQGIGAAILVPASLGLVVDSFGPARRAHGVSLWGAAAAAASGLGPPVGGLILEVSTWRWVFLVNVPLGVITVIAARRWLSESRAFGRRRVPDLWGTALLAAALGLLTFGLIKGPDWGWASTAIVASFVFAAVAFAGFVLSSRSHPAPIIELEFLRLRSFVAGNVLLVIASAGFYAYLLTHVLYLNYVWGYSLLRAGLAVVPAAIVATVVAALVGRVADRHGYRLIAAVGALIWAGSLVWYLERVGRHADFLGDWLPGQLLQGIGIAATLPILTSAALARLPAGASFATASAVVSSTRQVGAVIGVAVLVILVGTPAPGAAADVLRRGWAFAATCFVAVAIGSVLLGRARGVPEPATEPEPASPPGPVTPPVDDVEIPDAVPPAVDLDPVVLAQLRDEAQQVELEAGSYLFHAGQASDALYVVSHGRLQVLRDDAVVAEVGPGQVVGEVGLLTDASRSASIRARRDSTLLRVTKVEFGKFADTRLLGTVARGMAARLHQVPPAVPRATRDSVVAVVGIDAGAPTAMVATELCAALSTRLRSTAPGRIDRSGLERAEQDADRVILDASVDDGDWRDFCLRVADRIVLVSGTRELPSEPLPDRATGADLVLSGPPADRAHRRAWENHITPRSVHTLDPDEAGKGLRALVARIAGRSVGLVLSGGGARAFAHLGVMDELRSAGITVDRYAGCSVGATLAAFAAVGMDPAEIDTEIYDHFLRDNPFGDFTLSTKGLVRGKRIAGRLRDAFGERLVEELPHELRCVSVDLTARRLVVHRRGPVADILNCAMRLPGLLAPMVYEGALHVDGGLLANLPVGALARQEGPLLAVNVATGDDSRGRSGDPRPPKVPGVAEALMRAMLISGGTASKAAPATADLVIRPRPAGVGFMEFQQIDRAREAGRVAVRDALPQIMSLVRG